MKLCPTNQRYLKLVSKAYFTLKHEGGRAFLDKLTSFLFYKTNSGRHYLVCRYLPFILKKFPWALSYLIDAKSNKYRYLPRLDERIIKTDNFLDDFDWLDFDFGKFYEVNLVMRGDSKSSNLINKNIPTFFLNPKQTPDPTYSDYYFLTGDFHILKRFLGSDENSHKEYAVANKSERVCYMASFAYALKIGYHSDEFTTDFSRRFKLNVDAHLNDISRGLENKKISTIGGVLTKHKLPNFQIGSGLGALISLLHLADKVNVYGWDQYLDSEVREGFSSQVKGLCRVGMGMGNTITSLINYIYAHRILSEHILNVNIYGRIAIVKKYDWIPRYAFPVIYRE